MFTISQPDLLPNIFLLLLFNFTPGVGLLRVTYGLIKGTIDSDPPEDVISIHTLQASNREERRKKKEGRRRKEVKRKPGFPHTP